MGEADRQAIEAAAAELRAALDTGDLPLMQGKDGRAAAKAAYRLAEEVYKEEATDATGAGTSGNGASGAGRAAGAGRTPRGGAGEAPRNGGQEAEEVDYEVVDDEKKKS